jgi:serine/threonine-protein kinase
MDSTASPPPLVRIGRTVGEYLLVGELGRGGFGVVFEARDRRDDSRVALKTLHANLSSDQGQRAFTRFLMEVRAVRQVRHPNVVKLIDAGRVDADDGSVLAYYAMEYLDGLTLEQRVRDHGPLGPVEAGDVIRQSAEGLYAAHVQGIIHRDVKPGNIMVTSTGRAVVTDFGVCKIRELQNITAAGQVVGTARYLSPEQFMGTMVDARSDVFALGALLFYVLTGEHLRVAKDLVTLSRVVAAGEDLERVRAAEILPAFRKFLLSAVALDPGRRHQSALEFANALRDVCARKEVLETLASAATAPSVPLVPLVTVGTGGAGGPPPLPPRADANPTVSDHDPAPTQPMDLSTLGGASRAAMVPGKRWLLGRWPPAALAGVVALVTVVALQWIFPSRHQEPARTPAAAPAPAPAPAPTPTQVVAAHVTGRVTFAREFQGQVPVDLLPSARAPVPGLYLCAYRPAEHREAPDGGGGGAPVVRAGSDVRLGCGRTDGEGAFDLALPEVPPDTYLATFFCDGDTAGLGTAPSFCVMTGVTTDLGRPIPASLWTGSVAGGAPVALHLEVVPPGGGTNVSALGLAAHVFVATHRVREVAGSFRPDPVNAVSPCTAPECQAPLEVVMCPAGGEAPVDPVCTSDDHAPGGWSSVAVHGARDGVGVAHDVWHALVRRWRSTPLEARPVGGEPCEEGPLSVTCRTGSGMVVEGFVRALAVGAWMRPVAGDAVVLGRDDVRQVAARPVRAGAGPTLGHAVAFFVALQDDEVDVPASPSGPACGVRHAPADLLRVWSHPVVAGAREGGLDLRAYVAGLEAIRGASPCLGRLVARLHL